eukprot:9051772-Lingulodinium_polyedra.AAC.1
MLVGQGKGGGRGSQAPPRPLPLPRRACQPRFHVTSRATWIAWLTCARLSTTERCRSPQTQSWALVKECLGLASDDE